MTDYIKDTINYIVRAADGYGSVVASDALPPDWDSVKVFDAHATG